MKFNNLKDFVVTDKIVFVRCDLNVPIFNEKIIDDTRIIEALDTINYLIKNNAKVVIATHLGRPKEKDISFSTKIIAEYLNQLIKAKVYFVNDCIGEKVKNAIKIMKYGEVLVLENLRFYKEEEQCDLDFAKKLADGMNIFVNEAFSCSHRVHASIFGVPLFIRPCAGIRFEKEINFLADTFREPPSSAIAIIGGSKISTKIDILRNLSSKVQYIVPAGGILNNFLKALNVNIGKSLHQENVDKEVLEIKKIIENNNCKIILPEKVVVSKSKNDTNFQSKFLQEIEKDDIILDMDLDFINNTISDILSKNKLCIWNGPVGLFEVKPFDRGSIALSNLIAKYTKNKTLKSIAGGGDVIAAISEAGNLDDFTFISTGGGAFLEFAEGRTLPGIEILKKLYDGRG